jgi:hypothetical protein
LRSALTGSGAVIVSSASGWRANTWGVLERAMRAVGKSRLQLQKPQRL